MRKPTSQLSGLATAPDNRKSSLSFTTNNIWKMFLVFVVVAFLNTIYITKVVLAPEEANQRFDQQLLASFAIGGSTNRSAWEDVLVDVPDDKTPDQPVEIMRFELGDDPLFDDQLEDKTINEPGKISAAEMEAVKMLQHPNVQKTSLDVVVNKAPEEAVDKSLAEEDVLVAVKNKNTDENNLVKTTAENVDLHVHWPKASTENLDEKNLAKAQSEVKNVNKVVEEENAEENEGEDDEEDENDNDDEDEGEDEDENDDEDEDDNDEENDNDTDNQNEVNVNTLVEHDLPVKLTNAEHAMVETFLEHNNHIEEMNKMVFNHAVKKDADGEIEVQYRARIKPKKKKKKRRRKKKIHNTKTIGTTYSPEQKLYWKPKDTTFASNVTNEVFYKDIPAEFLVEDPSLYLWDRPEMMIPEWMKDYFRWHRWKRSTWKDKPIGIKKALMGNSTELQWWEKERWLIAQCLLSMDKKKCGGTADRLKPIPVLLRVAYENKRVFLIRWTRPTQLENFLMPPAGGFDWRLPPELNDVMDDYRSGKRLPTRKLILEYAAGGLALVRARYQTGMPARSYNELVFGENAKQEDINEYGFDTMYSRIWKLMFTPTAPIQTILQSKLSILGLVPNQYVSAHLRALYAVDTRPPQEVKKHTKNALACATTLFTGVPIFFASDSPLALETAHGFNGTEVIDPKNQSMTLKVLTAVDVPTPSKKKGNDTQPWHLDSYIGPIENFYDTFVDLYMLAMGGCVTYGKGGYGNWASLIGGHTECQIQQALPGKRIKDPETQLCKFNATNESYETIVTDFHKRFPSVFGKGDTESGPLFLPLMD